MSSRRFTARCLRASTERIAQPEGLLRCGNLNPVYVRFGSGADISRLLSNVRFTPESGHREPACYSRTSLKALKLGGGLFPASGVAG